MRTLSLSSQIQGCGSHHEFIFSQTRQKAYRDLIANKMLLQELEEIRAQLYEGEVQPWDFTRWE